MAVHQAIVSSVRLELLPKSTIDIFITVIEADGIEGVIASASVAVSAALADAGIEILGLVVSCSAVGDIHLTSTSLHLTFAQSIIGEEIWLDPNEDEATASQGTVILSCMPALGTVTSVWQNGRIPPTEVMNVSSFIPSELSYLTVFKVSGGVSRSMHRYTWNCRAGSPRILKPVGGGDQR